MPGRVLGTCSPLIKLLRFSLSEEKAPEWHWLPLPHLKVGAEKTLSDLVPYLAGEGLFSEKSTLPLSLTSPREEGSPRLKTRPCIFS